MEVVKLDSDESKENVQRRNCKSVKVGRTKVFLQEAAVIRTKCLKFCSRVYISRLSNSCERIVFFFWQFFIVDSIAVHKLGKSFMKPVSW